MLWPEKRACEREILGGARAQGQRDQRMTSEPQDPVALKVRRLRAEFTRTQYPQEREQADVLKSAAFASREDFVAVGDGGGFAEHGGDGTVFFLAQVDGVTNGLLVEVPAQAIEHFDFRPDLRRRTGSFARNDNFEGFELLPLLGENDGDIDGGAGAKRAEQSFHRAGAVGVRAARVELNFLARGHGGQEFFSAGPLYSCRLHWFLSHLFEHSLAIKRGLDALGGRVPDEFMQLQAEADGQSVGENPFGEFARVKSRPFPFRIRKNGREEHLGNTAGEPMLAREIAGEFVVAAG